MNPQEEWRLARERGAETAKRPAARTACYKPRTKRLEITLTNGISLLVPIAYIEGLHAAAAADLREIEIFGLGSALVFPKLDEVVSVHGLIDGVFGSKAWMRDIGRAGGSVRSEAKSSAARENGKKGGRPRNAA
ncbi:DUF2442 domain-containing protein [Paraburkholderia phenazinium]|uniref:DUF2442 domain-containing protein n=1 Tax=Paraburkholderia phenazinium TaxID=60549 RepID=A0A1G8KNC2_9BURK|nr:DUF2442 domain-containing protein [Paraburkholderia phenazinium]SDI44908.1 Protein of unknown function [Paraburkholderia phenazinium]